MDEPIESLYFNWLVAKVTDPHARTPSQTHWKLLRELHSNEFVWHVARDDNRAEDGVNLRDPLRLGASDDELRDIVASAWRSVPIRGASGTRPSAR